MLYRYGTTDVVEAQQLLGGHTVLHLLYSTTRCGPTRGRRRAVSRVTYHERRIWQVTNLGRYNRGWRYHIPSQTWMSSPLFANFDPRESPPTNDMPYFQGPIITFNAEIFKRTQQTLQLSPVDFESTRQAHLLVAEDNARKESLKSPNGSVTGQSIPVR